MASGVPQLVALLGAHFGVGDEERALRLRRLLLSVEAQTHQVLLLASWSSGEAECNADCGEQEKAEGVMAAQGLAAQVEATFVDFERRGIACAMPRLHGRRSQFEHYDRLREPLQKIFSARSTCHGGNGWSLPWVFFTDDDDIWHPHRAEEFLLAAKAHPGVGVVASRINVSPGLGPRLPPSATAADVSRLWREGHLRESRSAKWPMDTGLFGAGTGEYFDSAMALPVFEAFFHRHNAAVLANRFADIRFRTFALCWAGGVHRFMPRGGEEQNGAEPKLPACWMYYYDRPTEPYISPPSADDTRYISAEMQDPLHIAALRQTLDCVLFQLAPVDGPLRISTMDFVQRLLGFLDEQSRATVLMALDRCHIHGVAISDDA